MDKERIKNAMLMGVEEQLMNNEPLIVKETLDRLISEGWSKGDSKRFIAECLMVEMFEMNKYKKPFQLERYTTNLKKLPKRPYEEEEEEV